MHAREGVKLVFEYFSPAREDEIKLRCIRQAGTILLPPEQGGMTAREERKGAGRPSPGKEIIESSQLTQFQEVLEQGGITRETANTWQKVARVPEDKFEVYFTEAERKMGEMLEKIDPKYSMSSIKGTNRPHRDQTLPYPILV
jgi:hypothetical protein